MALLNVDWECVDSAAIRCYGRTGQLGAVRRLWQQLTKAEVSPSVFTFNSLLDGTYFFELIKGAAWHTLLKFLFDPQQIQDCCSSQETLTCLLHPHLACPLS